NPADADATCRRYPDPQPEALRAALADLYAVAPERLVVGRGSDEAIDLLVRATCEAGRDAVLVTPPVFGMYAVSARLQGAPQIGTPPAPPPPAGAIPIRSRRRCAQRWPTCMRWRPSAWWTAAAATKPSTCWCVPPARRGATRCW